MMSLRLRSQRQVPGPVFLLSLGVLFLSAACGGEGGSSGEGSAPRAKQAEPAARPPDGENDPCELVTAAEAGQVLAATAEAERPSEANNEYLATCRYVAPRGDGVVVLVVGVSRKNGPVGFRNAKRMEEEGFETQPVSGVGDDTFWVGGPLHTLYVLKGAAYLSIGGDVRLEQARPLALRALERLR